MQYSRIFLLLLCFFTYAGFLKQRAAQTMIHHIGGRGLSGDKHCTSPVIHRQLCPQGWGDHLILSELRVNVPAQPEVGGPGQ